MLITSSPASTFAQSATALLVVMHIDPALRHRLELRVGPLLQVLLALEAAARVDAAEHAHTSLRLALLLRLGL